MNSYIIRRVPLLRHVRGSITIITAESDAAAIAKAEQGATPNTAAEVVNADGETIWTQPKAESTEDYWRRLDSYTGTL